MATIRLRLRTQDDEKFEVRGAVEGNPTGIANLVAIVIEDEPLPIEGLSGLHYGRYRVAEPARGHHAASRHQSERSAPVILGRSERHETGGRLHSRERALHQR